MKLKGSVSAYLTALDDEIERVKTQRGIPYEVFSGKFTSWDEYLTHLENVKVEACLLMEFEVDDE